MTTCEREVGKRAVETVDCYSVQKHTAWYTYSVGHTVGLPSQVHGRTSHKATSHNISRSMSNRSTVCVCLALRTRVHATSR